MREVNKRHDVMRLYDTSEIAPGIRCQGYDPRGIIPLASSVPISIITAMIIIII